MASEEDRVTIRKKAQPCRSSIVAANGSLYLRIFGLLICVRKLAGGIKDS